MYYFADVSGVYNGGRVAALCVCCDSVLGCFREGIRGKRFLARRLKYRRINEKKILNQKIK